MNPLDQYPEIRKYLYILQWVVNGILTVAGAYFLISGTDVADLPDWYVFTVGVAPVLWTYLGITAQANTPSEQPPAVPPQSAEPLPQPLPEEDPPPMYPEGG